MFCLSIFAEIESVTACSINISNTVTKSHGIVKNMSSLNSETGRGDYNDGSILPLSESKQGEKSLLVHPTGLEPEGLNCDGVSGLLVTQKNLGQHSKKGNGTKSNRHINGTESNRHINEEPLKEIAPDATHANSTTSLEYAVELIPNSSKTLGLLIQFAGNGISWVIGFTKNKPVEKSGKVTLGDQIVRVNKILMANLSNSQIFKVLKKAAQNESKVTLILRKNETMRKHCLKTNTKKRTTSGSDKELSRPKKMSSSTNSSSCTKIQPLHLPDTGDKIIEEKTQGTKRAPEMLNQENNDKCKKQRRLDLPDAREEMELFATIEKDVFESANRTVIEKSEAMKDNCSDSSLQKHKDDYAGDCSNLQTKNDKCRSESSPRIKIKYLHKVGDKIMARNKTFKEWCDGIIEGFVSTSAKDERYGEVRRYRVKFTTNEEIVGVAHEHNVIPLKDIAVSNEQLSAKGIQSCKDKESSDKYAKLRGWYEYEGNIFASSSDALEKACRKTNPMEP